jgi:hypothetical protein
MPFSKKARGDEFFASPGGTGEPATGDDPGALDANIVAALCHLAEVINQRLQFGPSSGQQGFAVEGGGFGGHSLSVAGQARK